MIRRITLSICVFSAVLSSTAFARMQLGKDWVQATASAPWPEQSDHTVTVFNGKMWLIGNQATWYSSNGTIWNRSSSYGWWDERSGHTTMVLDGRMWVVGGEFGRPSNHVFATTDGFNWTTVTLHAQWSPRTQHASVVHDGKMWVLGGLGDHGLFNDVWYSTNGTSWTCATRAAGWSPACGHQAVSLAGRIWVIGVPGSGFNTEIWSSPNGITWTRVLSVTPWTAWPGVDIPVFDPKAVVCDGRIWVMGGRDMSTGIGRSEVWYSSDGYTWFLAILYAAWPGRTGFGLVVFDRKMWILGGWSPGPKGTVGRSWNDVWYSSPPGPPTSSTLWWRYR